MPCSLKHTNVAASARHAGWLRKSRQGLASQAGQGGLAFLGLCLTAPPAPANRLTQTEIFTGFEASDNNYASV